MSIIKSYWKAFRVIFVLFFLYLIGDALWRWDGFSYYSSFSEFLPNLALVSIFWSLIAIFASFMIWLPTRIISLVSGDAKWHVLDRLSALLFLVILLGAAAWTAKRSSWITIPAILEVKSATILIVVLLSIFTTTLIELLSAKFRWNKANYALRFLYVFVIIGVILWLSKRIIPLDVPVTTSWRILQLAGISCATYALTWLFRNKYDSIQTRIAPLVWIFLVFLIFSVTNVSYRMMKNDYRGFVIPETQSAQKDYVRPNIILVTFDALTTKNMSAYGYSRLTTPFISEWAQKAALFTGMKAAGNWTSSTTASLMTGKRVWTHGVFQAHGYKIHRASIENLPLIFKANGYYNMAYIANQFASVYRFNEAKTFDIHRHTIDFKIIFNFVQRIELTLNKIFGHKFILYDWVIKSDFIFGKLLQFINKDVLSGKGSILAYDTKKVFAQLIEDIAKNPPEPYFAWIHLFPPHAPYTAPAPYWNTFAADLKESAGDMQKIRKKKGTVLLQQARYDELIRYCDRLFEEFITSLTERDKLKNTVIILSSDHGELFEDFYIGHGRSYLHDPVTSIPLMIKLPDTTEGRVIANLVEQIDIPATILELAGIEIPPWMEGRSLAGLIEGKALPERPVFSMNFEQSPSRAGQISQGVVAVWEDVYKLVHTIEKNDSVLYNLRQDPDELYDLSGEKPELRDRLLYMIKEQLSAAGNR